MSALIYPLLGAVALLTALAIAATQMRDGERPTEEPGRGIRVNPDREPW